jgi:hypothetical protein
MSAADSLFCFTSNEIDSHFCPNCRAPMLVRSASAGRDYNARTFECFNCATVVVVMGEIPKLRLAPRRSLSVSSRVPLTSNVRHSKRPHANRP